MKRSFTLIELICVCAIAILVLSIAVGSVIGWGRSAAMRTSASGVKSSLSMARQWALTHGEQTSFSYSNTVDSGLYAIGTASANLIGATNRLAGGLTFSGTNFQPICFLPDGACSGLNWSNGLRHVILVERGRPAGLSTTVTVFQATGYIRLEE